LHVEHIDGTICATDKAKIATATYCDGLDCTGILCLHYIFAQCLVLIRPCASTIIVEMACYDIIPLFLFSFSLEGQKTPVNRLVHHIRNTDNWKNKLTGCKLCDLRKLKFIDFGVVVFGFLCQRTLRYKTLLKSTYTVAPFHYKAVVLYSPCDSSTV
jgi:hypothetical protein